MPLKVSSRITLRGFFKGISMKKYRYGKGLFTFKQIEFLMKRKYVNNWQEKLDIMTRHPVEDIHKRSCLKCSREFETMGKFMRVCGYCKKSEEWAWGEA